MEQWQDQGIVLSARPHGEGGAVVSVLTENHGRHAGYVRGAHSTKMRGTLEPGTLVGINWQARIEGNLGTYALEQDRALASGFMGDPLKLGALLSACSLCDAALPEREGHEGLFYGLLALMEALDSDIWGAAYVMWEIALLKELGFGLNLTRCAGGGDADGLAYVSPKSGHAVSLEAGEPYKDKLLPLPAFLMPARGEATGGEVLKGLEMTGHFLEHWVFTHHSKGVPEQRIRFQERFSKRNAV
ncbi:MAG: DNA repair protein RecO [Rhodospirillales bacterium]|nr:DNA repair protein RecO [Rhodospirillales bacterium]MCB9995491.1 DNA repair protein RecO [Rhodospirillales bacterium]